MTKNILVKTDDPVKPKITLVFTGKVESVAKITPKIVRLNGVPGDKLEKIVTIMPSDKYTFDIKSLAQRHNQKIKASLIDPESDGKPWQVRIKASSKIADDLYDVVTLATDSKYKPLITIRVYAIFTDKKNLKKGS
ncbi:MAG: hypothetical protein GY729_20445 [Desulfobacteraceae bacterium]|nr:hypothetical protein [Desulfobacteraceae bacterium]